MSLVGAQAAPFVARRSSARGFSALPSRRRAKMAAMRFDALRRLVLSTLGIVVLAAAIVGGAAL
ncbi:MAG TPA: hypothetical protein VN923_00320, partial [Thermoanaerobaculia bacterium]|nr:hypothetical protein [Thermoanaerobaculia bacterium]